MYGNDRGDKINKIEEREMNKRIDLRLNNSKIFKQLENCNCIKIIERTRRKIEIFFEQR